MNALLIVSRGWAFVTGRCSQDKTLHPFGAPPNGHVRLPGTWGGACANCRWKDHTARCDFYDPNEARFIPAPAIAAPAPPPLTPLQQITDAGDDDDEEMGEADVEELE